MKIWQVTPLSRKIEDASKDTPIAWFKYKQDAMNFSMKYHPYVIVEKTEI